jgi:hypothetical protein
MYKIYPLGTIVIVTVLFTDVGIEDISLTRRYSGKLFRINKYLHENQYLTEEQLSNGFIYSLRLIHPDTGDHSRVLEVRHCEVIKCTNKNAYKYWYTNAQRRIS